MPNPLIIELSYPTADCFICGTEWAVLYGIETYEGEIFDPKETWMEPGFFSSCCRICYDAHCMGRFTTTRQGRLLAAVEGRLQPSVYGRVVTPDEILSWG
jgi:hypothetical protein